MSSHFLMHMVFASWPNVWSFSSRWKIKTVNSHDPYSFFKNSFDAHQIKFERITLSSACNDASTSALPKIFQVHSKAHDPVYWCKK